METHRTVPRVLPGQALPPLILFVGMAAALLAGVLHHELWLDEAHHWIASRESDSLASLWNMLRYEGHPVLWNLLLWGVAGISGAPLAMQLLHAGIILVALALLIFRGPFPFWMKAILPFGYYFFFEYGMLSRNYALGILLAFAFCIAYDRRRPLWMGMALFLLVNTHLLGVWLAGLLVLIIIIQNGGRRSVEEKSFSSLGIILFLFAAGIALAAWQIIPPEDHPQMVRWTDRFLPSGEWVDRWLLTFWKSMAPVPDPAAYHFWNTNWIAGTHPVAAKIGGFLFMLLPLWLFRRKPAFLILPYGMALGVFLLQLFLERTYARHLGYLYVALLVALWLFQNERPGQRSAAAWALPVQLALSLIFTFQLAAGVWAFRMDWKWPFSEARRTALFLQEQAGSATLVTAEYCFGESLNAYLQESLYYPEQPGRTFCEWQVFDASYLTDKGGGRFFLELAEFLQRHPARPVILAHYEPLPEERHALILENGEQGVLLTSPLATFDKALKRMENYYLYKVAWEQALPQPKE